MILVLHTEGSITFLPSDNPLLNPLLQTPVCWSLKASINWCRTPKNPFKANGTGHQAVSLNSSQGLRRFGLFFPPSVSRRNDRVVFLFKYLYPLWLLPERPNSSPIMRIHRNANKSPRVSISDDIVLLNCFLDVTQYRVSSSRLALEPLPARLHCPRPNYLLLIIAPSTLGGARLCVRVFLCKHVSHFLCWFFPLPVCAGTRLIGC